MQESPRDVRDWGEIVAANDTNKFIIMKFMRKGFTSLSAEELATTMISPDFTTDFQNVTKENWVANYQFKVVERLNKCNFNLKWKTRPATGTGYMANFFDLCKRGDTGGILKFFREKYKSEQEILDEVEPASNKTGLHFAVEEGQVQVVEYLLKKGARVDARDKLLRTPLHMACVRGHAVIANLLIDYKCDTFERDVSGRTAMHFAVCCGSVEASLSLITVLSRDSMDLVHMTDHTGRTPLHYAVFADVPKQVKVVEQLIMLGANVNAADQERRTPLHTAAEEGKASLIPILIQNGASPGLKDYQSNTAFELAKTEHIRELIIVNAPNSNYHPNKAALDGLVIDGNKKRIQVVANLPTADYYEPFEHAQPRKRLPKVNKKKEEQEKQNAGVEFVCSHNCQPAQVIPPEELCSNCRPLGPSNEWLKQKKASLPYNIRNYQEKLVEMLKRTQEFGVTSYQHVRKPYLFTGSWMEYVRNQEDLNLQISGCKSFEAVMKVFNIIFPYDKPLPKGNGDELGLANAYSDTIQFDPKADLKDCHPDKLRERLDPEVRAEVKASVDDVNDLLTMQQQMKTLVTANEMAMVNIEAKEEQIAKLKAELAARPKQAAPQVDQGMLQQVALLKQQLQQSEKERAQLQVKVDQLVYELEAVPKGPSNNEIKLNEQVIQLKLAKKRLEDQLLKEQERNMQLRTKAGQAFMEALNDPLLQSTGGKRKDVIYCPEDDNALVRLLQTISRRGGANLEQLLLDAGDPNKYISIVQFDGLLKLLGTPQTDYTPLYRITGFLELQGNSKKIKVSTALERIYGRKAMRAEVEEQTLRHIATYIEKREFMSVDKLFNMFDVDEKDGMLTENELVQGLQSIKINVNQQLKRILLAMFDHNKDGTVDKQEFVDAVSKYLTKGPITVDDIEGDTIGKQDKEDLVKMVNEARSKKPVYEDFSFDPDDLNATKSRKEEISQLIKSGKMPTEPLKGEVIVRLDNFTNLPQINGKNQLIVRLKQSYFDEQGVEQQRKNINKSIPSLNREEEKFDPPLRIKILDLFNVNMNTCWDVLTLQLFLTDDPASNKALFIGECYIKWKHCTLPSNKNYWQDQQVWLQDPERKATALRDGVSGQMNIATIYLEAGQRKSSFNPDGSLKQAPAKYGQFTATQVKNDLRQHQTGDAGVLEVVPKMLSNADQVIFGPTVSDQYAIRFRFSDGAPVTSDDGQFTDLSNPTKLKFVCASVVGVKDTTSDAELRVEVIRKTPQGVQDEELANGTVPLETLRKIFAKDPAFKKSFQLPVTNKAGKTASLMIQMEFKTKESQESAQVAANDNQQTNFTNANLSNANQANQKAMAVRRQNTTQSGQNTQNRVAVDLDTLQFDQDVLSEAPADDQMSVMRSEEGATEAAKEAKIKKQLDLVNKVLKENEKPSLNTQEETKVDINALQEDDDQFEDDV